MEYSLVKISFSYLTSPTHTEMVRTSVKLGTFSLACTTLLLFSILGAMTSPKTVKREKKRTGVISRIYAFIICEKIDFHQANGRTKIEDNPLYYSKILKAWTVQIISLYFLLYIQKIPSAALKNPLFGNFVNYYIFCTTNEFLFEKLDKSRFITREWSGCANLFFTLPLLFFKLFPRYKNSYPLGPHFIL